MRRDVARRPHDTAPSRILAALASTLLLVVVITAAVPQQVLAGTTMAAACDGVRLRTGPSTSDTTAATVTAGTQVTVEATVTGGSWSASCAGNAVSGDAWHQISELGGQSVAALYGVPFVYSATGLFEPAAAPTPTPTADPIATPTPTPDPFATPTPSPTPDPFATPTHPPPPSPTPFLPVTEGIDVSHWQGTIDWPLVASAGKRFAYMKASEGTDIVDTFNATNRAQARAVGLYGTDLGPVLLANGVLDPVGQTPTLTLTPSASVITWGATVVVKASFGPVGAGRSFTLQGARDGVTWEPIATVTTDAEGNASFSYRPANNLYYRAPSTAHPTSGP